MSKSIFCKLGLHDWKYKKRLRRDNPAGIIPKHNHVYQCRRRMCRKKKYTYTKK